MNKYEKVFSNDLENERHSGHENPVNPEKLNAGVCTLACAEHPNVNEDRVFVGRSSFGVFDGVGGHEGGTHASTFAGNRLGGQVELLPVTASVAETKRSIERLFHETNVELLESVREHPELGKERATTASVVKVLEDFGGQRVAVVGHVGDSRIYVLPRGGELRQVTIDDDYAAPHVGPDRARELQRELSEAEHPEKLADTDEQLLFSNRHRVTQVLGKGGGIRPQIYDVPLGEGDLVLATSDGIHDNLTTQEIAQILRQSSGNADAARNLVQASLHRSRNESHSRAKPDDMSAVVVGFSESDPAQQPISLASVTSFEKLNEELDSIAGLQGSQKFYPREELKQLVEEVRSGEKSVEVLTNTGRLRDKVAELLEHER